MSGIAKRRAAAAASAENNPAYQERLQAIRQAAGTVFHRRGFRATKLSDIALEAGVDRASLYYYVGSKEQLFRDVVSEAVSANIAATEQIVLSDLAPGEKIVQIIRELMVSFVRYYPYMYVFVQEDFVKLHADMSGDGEWADTVREWNNRYFRLLRGVINDGLDQGEMHSPLPAGIVANCLIGMMNHSNLWFRPDGLLDAEEIARGMAKLVLDGLSIKSE